MAASTQQLRGVYKQTAVSCSHSSHALQWMWSLSTEGILPPKCGTNASVWDKLACHSLWTLGWHNPCIAAINVHEMDCDGRNHIMDAQIRKCHRCHLCVGLWDVPFSYGVTFFLTEHTKFCSKTRQRPSRVMAGLCKSLSALPSTGLAFQIQSKLRPNYCYCFATLRKKDPFHLAFVSIFALTVRGKALSKLIV